MALYGRQVSGVIITMAIYVVGVIFFSLTNFPGPNKKVRIGRFQETRNFRAHEAITRKQSIYWCSELKYLNSDLITPLLTSPSSLKISPHRSKLITEDSSKYLSDNSRSSSNKMKNVKNNDSTDILTALASFPGSGNTWLRYLLQQSTGVFTGSIYKDYGLQKSGFPAENVSNKSVLVVKTHEWGHVAMMPFSKAILLVRDPDKAILAEFNRQSGGHIGFASPDRYKRVSGKYWQQFVSNKLRVWENMNLSWARNFTGTIYIVYYDDIVANVESELRKILIFLDFPINEGLLACAITRKEGIFRRKKKILPFDPYSTTMRTQIESKKKQVYSLLGRY